jgi:hypothetical protein
MNSPKGDEMKKKRFARFAIGAIAAGLAIGPASAQSPVGLPDYLAGISGTTPPSPADLATKNVLCSSTPACSRSTRTPA